MKFLLSLTALLLSGCVTVTDGEPETPIDPQQMAESRIKLGLGYLENGNMLKARENLEMAIKYAPNYYRSRIAMAHYQERVGENEKAESNYKIALRKSPKNGNVLNNYGAFLCKQGEFDKADQYFHRAIDQPYYFLLSASYENAGLCALKAQRHAQAESYFVKALDHEPTRPRSLLQLSKLMIDKEDYTQARLHLMTFNKRYGYQETSLKLLIDLESSAGNKALVQRYQNKLDQMLAHKA